MRKFISRIWVPGLLVMVAALQSFGIDAGRAVGLRRLADSLVLTRQADSSLLIEQSSDSTVPAFADTLAADSLLTDSLYNDTTATDSIKADTLILTARDTIKVPDSLKETDPFFYKYYIAVKDSTTRREVRDSLIMAGDTLELMKLDSLYIKDSTEVAQAKHAAWYASLTRQERKRYDAEQKLPALIAAANRKMAIKDSIKTRKDSIIQATPRILETFAFPDSLHYKRIITWTHDRDFHEITGLRDQSTDSSFNYNFHDYNFYKEDLNASWLGVAGSPVQLFDYFKRKDEDNTIYYAPYQIYSYTPETLPQYNTKTPYTELCYWGTLFANREKEESNIKILTTQNITPELNLTLMYTRNGSKGMLRNEDTDNRNAVIATNYTGKKYLMHAGFIYNRILRGENGGVVDEAWIRDTLVDAREIEVYLNNARTSMKRNTVFLDQTYRIPFTFLDKDVRARKKDDRLFAAASFDVVTVNPPYMTGGHGLANPDQPKAIARHEVLCSLEDVVREASGVLKPNGRFYMVHRPFRLAEIFEQLKKYKLEPKAMRLVYPYIDKEPNMVLIECLKSGKPMIKIAPPLIVYEKSGVYTQEICEIYGY